MEKCARCHRERVPRRSYCREHWNEYQRDWRRKNLDRQREWKREYERRYRANPEKRPLIQKWRRDRRFRLAYGLTSEQVAAMWEEQGHRCPICGSSDQPHVDHCHESGTVRAVLCGRCNKGLGHFKDDPARLEAAAEYLRRHAA